MASDNSPILLTVEGRVGRLLLRRPSAGNAFTSEMLSTSVADALVTVARHL